MNRKLIKKDINRHLRNNQIWEKIHKRGFYSIFPHSYTVSLFENRFKNKNLSILELGCGSGNDQLYLRKKYKDVSGIDISHSAILNTKKLLKKNKIKNLKNLAVMDLKDVQNIKRKFNIIYDFRSISNLPKSLIKQIFVKIPKIMKPKGYVIFKLYSNKWIKNKSFKRFNTGKTKNIYLSTFFKKEVKSIISNRFKIILLGEDIYTDKIKNKIFYAEFNIIARLK